MKAFRRHILIAVVLTGPALAEIPPRTPSIGTDPQHPHSSQYTEYKPQPPARVKADVTNAISNGSFISRTLGVISRDGSSKNFETITGQDGLTFGIKDFATDGGIASFFKAVNKAAPGKFSAAFGSHAADLLNDPLMGKSWIEKNNAGGHGAAANDAGLIRFEWLRRGLDQLLTDPELRPVQLSAYREQTVDPVFKHFQSLDFKEEFSLATMIGIANSRGAGGMKSDLKAALAQTPGSGAAREKGAIKRLLETYVSNDPNPGSKDATLLKAGFSGVSPSNLSDSNLGHRGRRAFELFRHFPYASAVVFQELGDFHH